MRTLREWRTSRIMSMRDLAEDANITLKTLTDLEYARRIPNYQTMRRICTVLGVDASEIVEFVAAIEARGGRFAAAALPAESFAIGSGAASATPLST